jgi:tetratricopeptide (TPR) repeat protein
MRRPTVRRAVWFAALLPLSAASWAHITGKAPEQLGKVSFANSCLPAAQATLERGVALLHSFWFRESERAFREAIVRDPDCAIAGWGIASAFIGNTFATGPNPAQAQQAKEAIERSRATGRKTERERNFIEAIAQYYDQYPSRPHGQRMKTLSDAFELVAKRFPEDDEAQIFSAVYLTATQPLSDQTYAAALKAATILEVQFKKHPDHPGVAHYLIHSYDFPSIADKGMNAARRYSEIAPSAPHALHMPSHIFTRVGAWKDSAAINERSAAAAKETNEPNDGLHAMDYSVYAYLQLGQDADARRVLKEAREIKNFIPSVRSAPYALAAMPARIALERGAWDEAAKLEVEESLFPYTKSQTHYARAVGAARGGNPAAADAEVKALAGIVESLKGKDPYWATEVEVQRLTGAAWVEFANGNRDKGIALMRSAADMEDANEKSSLTPARMLPARELLGDMLLAAGKPVDALAEYEKSQIREPNRYRSLYGAGQAAAQANDRAKARHYFAKLLEMAGAGVRSSDIQAVRQHIARN